VESEGSAKINKIGHQDSCGHDMETNPSRETDARASLLCGWAANAPHS